MAIDTPHFRFPFRFDPDTLKVDVTEQDSDLEIEDCVHVLLSTDLGEREDVPDYGVRDPTFSEGGVDAVDLESTIREWEPRALTQLTQVDSTDITQRIRIVIKGRD